MVNANRNNEIKLYSISAAAKELSIRKNTLLDLISQGKIGIIEIGKRQKISHLELVQFIQSNTKKINYKHPKNNLIISAIINKHNHSEKNNSLDEINKIFDKIRGN